MCLHTWVQLEIQSSSVSALMRLNIKGICVFNHHLLMCLWSILSVSMALSQSFSPLPVCPIDGPPQFISPCPSSRCCVHFQSFIIIKTISMYVVLCTCVTISPGWIIRNESTEWKNRCFLTNTAELSSKEHFIPSPSLHGNICFPVASLQWLLLIMLILWMQKSSLLVCVPLITWNWVLHLCDITMRFVIYPQIQMPSMLLCLAPWPQEVWRGRDCPRRLPHWERGLASPCDILCWAKRTAP